MIVQQVPVNFFIDMDELQNLKAFGGPSVSTLEKFLSFLGVINKYSKYDCNNKEFNFAMIFSGIKL